MGDSKKISFGFSKMSKKNIVPSNIIPKDDKIEFIECVEKNSIKIMGQEEEKKKTELIIPMKIDSLLKHSMIQAIKENANSAETTVNTSEDAVALSSNSEGTEPIEELVSKSKPLTLDELAAKELLEDAKRVDKKDTKIYTVPLANKIGEGEKESSIEDYENIPVSDFGLAMLRGMGWQPDIGIGKNTKRVRPVSPILRPKGMGLGANKVCKQNQGNEEKNSVVTKGSSIKVLAGQHKNLYGIVEGFDEVSGRLIVKLTISSSIISLNEFLVQVVSKEEYNKLATMLNTQIDDNKGNNSLKPEQNKYGLLSGESIKKSNVPSANDTDPIYKSEMKRNKDNFPSNYKHSESSKHSKSHKSKHASKSRYSLSPDSKSLIKKPRSSRYSTSSDSSSSDSAKNYKSSKGKLQVSHFRKKTSSNRSDKIIISDSSDDSQDSSDHEKSKKKYKKHKSHHKRSKNTKHKSRSRSPKCRKNRKSHKRSHSP